MFEITDWEDVRKVAPAGALYFRYRRPTGVRRKFYEGGFAFPLTTEELADRKPMHVDGVFAVCFYSVEEAQKPADKGCPLIIQPPDCDELMVQFPRGWKPGDSSESLIIRELLNCQKDLARTAAGAADASLKLLEKVSHERDTMALEAEKNRIGPVWQLILEHNPQIKDLLIAAGPLVSAFSAAMADRMSSSSGVTTALAEVKKENQATFELAQQMTSAVKQLGMICGELRKEQKALRAELKGRAQSPAAKAIATKRRTASR